MDVDVDKVLVRSTIVTLNACSLREFSRVFEQQTGQPPPFRQHNCSSLLEYLRTLSDVVEISTDRNGETILTPVIDANSKDSHISMMIRSQKKAPAKTKVKKYSNFQQSTNTFSNSSRYSNYKRDPVPRATPFSNTNRQSYSYLQKLNTPTQCRQPTPNEVSNLIKIIKDYPTGVWLDRIKEIYTLSFGQSLGIEDDQLQNFLSKIPNINICNTGGVNKVSLKDTLNKAQSFLQQSNTQFLSGGSSILRDEKDTSQDRIQSKMEASFIKVLKSRPKGIWLTKFCEVYKEVVGADLNLRTIGVPNLSELINTYPHIFGVEDCHNPAGDRLLYYKKGIAPSEIYSQFSEKEKGQLLTTQKNKIQELVNHNPKGIPVKDLEDLYLKAYKEELPWVQLGYKNLVLLVEEMERNQMLVIRRSPSMGQVLMTYGPPPGQRSLTPTSPTAQVLPEDIIYTHAFEVQQLPEDLSVLQPAYISQVYNPSHLYLQLGGQPAQAFRLLEEQIQEFYDSPEAQRYLLPAEFLLGQVVCIAPYGNEEVKWHRVFIQKIEENTVEAFYIDYGSILTLLKSELRLIKKEFLQLPGQAIKCQLLGICPPASKDWGSPVTEWILNNASEGEVLVKFSPPSEKLLDKNTVVGILDIDLGDETSLKAELVRQHLAAHVQEELEENEEELLELSGDLEDEYIKDCEEEYISTFIPYKRIKRISFGEDMYPFHLVYYNFQLYMTYCETSSLFHKIKNLQKTLTIKELRLPFNKITEDKEGAIFNHMRRFNIPDVSGDKEHANLVTLYPIRSVMVMLYVMGHPQCKLIGETLMDEYADLDSTPNYWQDPNSVEDLSRAIYIPPRDDDTINHLCLMELIGLVGALKQDRVKILSSILPESTESHNHLVVQLEKLEQTYNRALQTLHQLERDCVDIHRYAVALFKK